jgi:hypothetical protein
MASTIPFTFKSSTKISACFFCSIAVQILPQPVAPSTRSSPGGKYTRPIHGLQRLGAPGNILGRLPGRESFVKQ